MDLCPDPLHCEFNDFRKTGLHFCALARCLYPQAIIAGIEKTLYRATFAELAENPRFVLLLAEKDRLLHDNR